MTQPAEPSTLDTDPPTDGLADERDTNSPEDGTYADAAEPDDAVQTVKVEDDTTARTVTL